MSLYERQIQLKEKCIRSLNDWKKIIMENLDSPEEKSIEFGKLKNIVTDYCVIDRDCLKHQKAIKQVEEIMSTKDSNGDTDDLDLRKLYSEFILAEAGSSSDNYEQDELWKEIFDDNDVMEVSRKKSNMAVSTYEDLGDSLILSTVFSPPIDPISKMVIRNPYKNRKCKHVYEYSTISNYIKQLKVKAKCPYIGCNNHHLKISDLVVDRNLETQITQYLDNEEEEHN